jgi:SOS response regulatory protein OraA/RecX
MAKAWQGHSTERQRIHTKLAQHGFTSTEITKIYDHVEIISFDENTEEKKSTNFYATNTN